MTLIERAAPHPGTTDDGRAVRLDGDEIHELLEIDDIEGLDELDRQARTILEAALERGRRDLATIRALPIRRAAWVRAHQEHLVVTELVRPPGGAGGTGAVVDAWQRHLVVVERVEHGLRQVRTAIGDSALAPDPELRGHEQDLRAVIGRRPATLAVWDLLFDDVATAAGVRP